KVLRSESEKRIKMQQEVVEVLETNAKSKKCNPVEAGLYTFKAWKLDSGIFLQWPCLYCILLGVVGVPDKKEIPLTVSRTPAFRRQGPQNPPKGQLPPCGVHFKPQIPVRRTVEIPLSLLTQKSHLQKKKKIKQLRKGEVSEL
ncbi:hypothetical protein FD755_001380, partial [Muntiacus reevesi]